MALMKSKPTGRFEYMSFTGSGEPGPVERCYDLYGPYDEEGTVPPAPEMRAGRSRICLDCALPLQTSGRSQAVECRCRVEEEAEDDWPAFSGIEIIFLLGLVMACIALSFWFWV